MNCASNLKPKCLMYSVVQWRYIKNWVADSTSMFTKMLWKCYLTRETYLINANFISISSSTKSCSNMTTLWTFI